MRAFRFLQSDTLEDILKVKEEERERARILAGGTNLLANIKKGDIKEGILIDVTRVKELETIEESDGSLRIGAGVTMRELLENEKVRKRLPYFQETLLTFANPLVRNRATLGGNLADASPIADTAPILIVLDAELQTVSAKGRRVIKLSDFFLGVNKTSLEANEIIESIIIPLSRTKRAKMIKLGLRNGYSCSVSSAAAAMELDGAEVKEVKIALGGVAPKPARAASCENYLMGKKLDAETIAAAVKELEKDISPITDVRGTAEYRMEIAKRQVRQAVGTAAGLEG
jgi:CO/xanthine dehydrogenase FAD-binding subunit